MHHVLKNILLILAMAFLVVGCVTSKGSYTQKSYRMHPIPHLTPKATSELQQGRRYFETGYYKRAMRMLLPLACDGVPEAEYAVGYMYYYGYGVAQDTDVGIIWIRRAADQGFGPAQEALVLTRTNERNKVPQPKSRPKVML